MEVTDEFKKLLARLTPANENNEVCVKFLLSHKEDLDLLFKKLLDEMSRASLNGRIKQLNFLEYCTGIVGNLMAPPEWNTLISQNLQRLIDHTIPPHLAPQSLVNILPANRFIDELLKAGLIDAATFDRVKEQLTAKERNLMVIAQSRPSRSQITKEEVLRRMEDDRERSKKYKERELAVVIGSEDEFLRMWETEGAINDHDLEMLKRINVQAGLE